MLGCQAPGGEGIVSDGGKPVGGLIDEDEVEPMQLRECERAFADPGDHHTIDLPVRERLQVLGDVHVPGLAQQHGVPRLGRDPLGARDDRRIHGIREARNDHPDGVRATPDQPLGEPVRSIAELFGGLEHALPGLRGDACLGISGKDERDSGLRDPGLPGDLERGDAWRANAYWHAANTHWRLPDVNSGLSVDGRIGSQMPRPEERGLRRRGSGGIVRCRSVHRSDHHVVTVRIPRRHAAKRRAGGSEYVHL